MLPPGVFGHSGRPKATRDDILGTTTQYLRSVVYLLVKRSGLQPLSYVVSEAFSVLLVRHFDIEAFLTYEHSSRSCFGHLQKTRVRIYVPGCVGAFFSA